MKPDYLDALASINFELDCYQIVLSQDGNIENPIIYKGPGAIFQKDESKFAVKFFCEGKVDIQEVFGKINRLAPGKIIERSNYYSLKAVDYSGNIWSASSIMPDINGGIEFDNFLVSGDFSVLNCHREDRHQYKGATLKLFYKDKHKIPCSTITHLKTTIGTE